MTIKATSIY